VSKTLCAACSKQWKTRDPTLYKNGENPDTKSIPMISGVQLLSHHGKKKFKLMFCDKHLNNLRHVTKYMNGSGILKIRNVITNKWRNASTLGNVV